MEATAVKSLQVRTTQQKLLAKLSALRNQLFFCLPERDIANLLVNIYYDRVSWLAFHRDEFWEIFALLYNAQGRRRVRLPVGFVSTQLAILAIAVERVTRHRLTLLRKLNIDT